MSILINSNVIDPNVQRIVEAVRNTEFAQQNSEAGKPVATAAQAATAARIPDAVLKQVLAAQIGSGINTGNLSNLAERLDSSLVTKVKDAGSQFIENNFGQVAATASNSVLSGLESKAPSSSRNPLPSLLSQMMTGRDAMLSDDPPADADKGGETVSKKEGFFAALGEALKGVSDEASQAAGALIGGFNSFAFSVLSSNTGSPDDKANEFRGFSALLHSKENGSTHNQAKDYDLNDPASWDGTRTPLPDDVSNSTGAPVITNQTLKDLNARKNSASQPAGDDQQSGGGKINTGVSGTGRDASVSQPVPDSDVSKRIAVTAAALTALQVRIESRITIIR